MGGRVPNGTDRDILLCKYPQILAAIESAYQKYYVQAQFQSLAKKVQSHFQAMGKNYR